MQTNTIGYIRFKGDTGSGKSRALDVIGQLCYKPIMCNAPTPAPLYRLIARWRGTLILDESDFKHSDETGDIVTILNSGFQKGRPVIRCRKENPDELEILPCYGPKVFATRGTWQDTALESRCTTILMQETAKKMPIVTATKFDAAQARLRRKLLLWRFRKLGAIHPEIGEDIDLGEVEPRVKQVAMPFLIAFEGNAEVTKKIQDYMAMRQEDNISQRNDSKEGIVIYAFFKLAQQHGKTFITSKLISEYTIETLKQDWKQYSPQRITRSLGRLGISKDRHKYASGRDYYIVWDTKVMERTRRRYILNPGEFDDLFIDLEV